MQKLGFSAIKFFTLLSLLCQHSVNLIPPNFTGICLFTGSAYKTKFYKPTDLVCEKSRYILAQKLIRIELLSLKDGCLANLPEVKNFTFFHLNHNFGTHWWFAFPLGDGPSTISLLDEELYLSE